LKVLRKNKALLGGMADKVKMLAVDLILGEVLADKALKTLATGLVSGRALAEKALKTPAVELVLEEAGMVLKTLFEVGHQLAW